MEILLNEKLEHCLSPLMREMTQMRDLHGYYL